MSTLHKVKAYFGMAPMEDYDDEYYDDEPLPSRGHYSRHRYADDEYDSASPKARYAERYPDRMDGRDYDDDGEYNRGGYRGGYEEVRDRFERTPSRLGPLRGGGSTRGALAMDQRRMAMLFDEGSALAKITTLRPKDYSEARTIGERFRDGTPVIMDLVSMDNADAKRLVDFAAGLAFALRGSFDKVATKVFLLSPADIEVTPEERRRMAEAGFYAQ